MKHYSSTGMFSARKLKPRIEKNFLFFNFPEVEQTFLPKPEEMCVQANEHNVQRRLPSFKFPSKLLATGVTSSLG